MLRYEDAPEPNPAEGDVLDPGGLTAWQSLIDAAKISSGQEGVHSRRRRRVGSLAVQIAKWKALT